jgi:hypothetical protein
VLVQVSPVAFLVKVPVVFRSYIFSLIGTKLLVSVYTHASATSA